MNAASSIIIPLINPNEPSARLAGLHVAQGQFIHQGDKICTLETTKSTVELTAETDGFVSGLTFIEGETVQAGSILGYLAVAPDWTPPERESIAINAITPKQLGLRISQPAIKLAEIHNLDLSQFSSDVFITEKMVQEMIDLAEKPELVLQDEQIDPRSIIIYGGGGHGKTLIDIIRMLSIYPILGIIDDNLPVGSSIMGIQVIGGSAILDELTKRGVHLAANAVGGIGDITSRINVFERLSKAGVSCPTLVHSTAFVEPSASLSEGVQVMPLAYIGSEAQIGFGAIVNTGAIVSHECKLGDYVNLSPGAILAGEVIVGQATLVGMGVTVNLRVKIGENVRIGNGATIKQDVPDRSIIRAGTIWPE